MKLPIFPKRYLTPLLLAVFSAGVTGAMLLVNGAVVLTVLTHLSNEFPPMLNSKGFLQFSLFVIPVLLVVVEWLVWDFLVGVVKRTLDAVRERSR